MDPAVLTRLRRSKLSSGVADVARSRLAARQRWAISAGASVWLIDLEPYETCRVVGVVKSLRVDPHEGHVEITINDGTGQVAARWTIRRHTPQLALAPGTAVVLEGAAAIGNDGRLALLEPGFQAIANAVSE
jgi:hypothetical protein